MAPATDEASRGFDSSSQVRGQADHSHHHLNRRRPNLHHHQTVSSSNTEEFSFRHKHMSKIDIIVFAMALLVSSTSASVLAKGEIATRETYSVQSVRDMVQKIFKEQKETQEKEAEEDWSASLGHLSGRVRREAGEEELEGKVFSMEQEDKLATLIGEVMACQTIPGLSLGVVRRGVRQALGYGVADMDTGRPVDSDTLFGIGSNTKAFAAATLAHLMTTAPPGKQFSWDTKLKDILEDFRLVDDLRTEQTTLMDVLSHRTGLASADLGLFAGYPLNMTTEDMCSRLRFLPEVAPFRSGWHYSNTLYIIVSRVCETVAGRDWVEVAREKIWQPLSMNSTDLTPEVFSRENVALPYILRMRVDDMFVQQDPGLFNIHPLEAAGAIMSSSTDMTKWMSYLLDVLNRPASVAEHTMAQLFTERTLLPENIRQFSKKLFPKFILNIGYGMGFMTSYYQGLKIYWHTGSLHGYTSHVTVMPGRNIAVYIGINGPSLPSSGRTLTYLTYFVLDLLSERIPWVNMTLVCPEKEKSPTAATDVSTYEYDYGEDSPDDYFHKDEDYSSDANHIDNYRQDYHGDDSDASPQTLLLPIDHYTGAYGHGLLGDLTIVREEERNSLLRMELGRLLVADLIPTDNESVFRVAARTPVSDTKEWETEQTLVFRHSKRNANKMLRDYENNTASEEDSTNSSASVGDFKSFSDVPFDKVQITWESETYTFIKHLRYETALDNAKLENDEAEKKDNLHAKQGNDVSRPAASTGSENGSAVGNRIHFGVLSLAVVLSKIAWVLL